MVDPINSKTNTGQVNAAEANKPRPRTFQDFKASLEGFHSAFGVVADLFPKENIKDIEFDGERKRFSVTYVHAQRSRSASHPKKELNDALKRVNVYAGQVISGKINIEEKTIEIEGDSLKGGVKKVPGRFSLERFTVIQDSDFRKSGEAFLKALEGNVEFPELTTATKALLIASKVTEEARATIVDQLTKAFMKEIQKENPNDEVVERILAFKADLATANLDRISTDLKVHTSPVLGKVRSQRLSEIDVRDTKIDWKKG